MIRSEPLPWYRHSVNGLVLLFLVEIVTLCGIVPDYFSPLGLLDATRMFAGAGFVALGMTLVIVSGGIDLSVGSLVALVSVTLGFSYRAGLPLFLAIPAGLMIGIAGGVLNGTLIAALRIHPLIVTLGTMALYRGLAYAVSNAEAVSRFPAWFTGFGQYYLFEAVPAQLPLFILVVAGSSALLGRTRFGRHVYAIGANETVARFSGIDVAKTKVIIYGLTGALTALAAIVETARSSTARANAGLGLELTAIAMVVLGGTKITGGSGTIAGTVVGVLILGYLQDAIQFAGVRSDWGLIVVGGLLILGVLLHQRLDLSRLLNPRFTKPSKSSE